GMTSMAKPANDSEPRTSAANGVQRQVSTLGIPYSLIRPKPNPSRSGWPDAKEAQTLACSYPPEKASSASAEGGLASPRFCRYPGGRLTVWVPDDLPRRTRIASAGKGSAAFSPPSVLSTCPSW